MGRIAPFGTPWHAANYNGDGTYDVVDALGRVVAEVTAWDSGDPINLIIAAPDLLAAAKDALAYLVELGLCRPDENPAAALDAAIKKAEVGDGKV